MQNAAGAGAATAAQIAATLANTDQAKASARNLNAEAAIKESEIPEPGEPGRPADSATASLKRQQAQESANRQLNITADTNRINQIVKNLGEQLNLTTEQIKEIKERILNLKEQGEQINLENLFLQLDIPRAHNEHAFESSTMGRHYRYSGEFIRQFGQVANSAASIRGMFPRRFQNETTTQKYPDGSSTYNRGSR